MIAKSDASFVCLQFRVSEGLAGARFISEDGSKSLGTHRHVTATASQAHLAAASSILHFLFISSGYFFSSSTVTALAFLYTAGWSLSLGAAHGPHERGACQLPDLGSSSAPAFFIVCSHPRQAGNKPHRDSSSALVHRQLHRVILHQPLWQIEGAADRRTSL